MAVLTNGDIDAAVNDYVNMVHRELGIRADYDAAVLRAQAVNTDTWIEANQASFNGALTPPYRTNASLKEKTYLFTAIANRRAKIAV